MPLNDGWTFRRGRACRRWLAGTAASAGDSPCDLPHSWNEQDTFQSDVVPYRGWAAYRREVAWPSHDDETETVIEAGGFYGTGDVWLDGRRIARVDGQFLGFRVPLPRRRAPRGTLAVRLTNRCARHVLPGIRDPDFILHGGLAGGLGLRRLPRFRIDEGAVRIACDNPLAESPRLDVDFAVLGGDGRPRRGLVRCSLRELGGLSCGASDVISITATADAPAVGRAAWHVGRLKPWSPTDPSRYEVIVELTGADGVMADRLVVQTGFRAAEFRPRSGFYLNGQRTPLFGCNRHESMPGFGSAMPPELQRDDACRLKALGCNFVRLSHYPQHPAFLDACDELGLLVYAEVASWKSVRRGAWHRAAIRQWEAMIRRDRHHPSILLWGLGNESRSRSVFMDLRGRAERLDPGRAITYAENHLYRARRRRTIGVPDVWGLNYEFDVLPDASAAARTGNVIVSEMANYPPASRGDAGEERAQVDLLDAGWGRIRDVPFVAGCLVWCLSDYATMRKRRYFRNCGVLDAWRQPKRAAAWMQMLRLEAPFLKAFADWSIAAGTGERRVEVFTNAVRVSAWRGDRCLGTTDGPGRVTLAVPFDGVEVELRGEHPRGVARDRLVPWDEPQAVVLVPAVGTASAASRATLDFTVAIHDRLGRVVGGHAADVAVSCTGPARLRCFSAAAVVRVAGGSGRGFITGLGAAGRVEVVAEQPGLRPGRATVEFV